MNTKVLVILIPMLLLLYKGASGQSIKQSVQTALDNNESLKSQKVFGVVCKRR